MTLTYALIVQGAAYGTQSARSAYQVANAILEKGHRIERIFFYQEGVHNASALSCPASDEFDLVKAWQGLAKAHQVQLHTCVAAALRRGIVSEAEAAQNGVSTTNIADGFEQVGLGSLAELLLTADRVLQF